MLREKLADTEHLLDDNVKLVGKTQRYLAEREQAAKVAAERAREAARVGPELAATRLRLKESERREQETRQTLDEVRAQAAEAGQEVAGMRAELAETNLRLEATEQQLRETGESLQEARSWAKELERKTEGGRTEAAEDLRRLEALRREAGEGLKQAQSRAEELGREMTSVRSELERTRARLEDSERRGLEAGAQMKEMQSRVEELGREATDARSELALTLTKLEESEARGLEAGRHLADVQAHQEESVRMLETLRALVAAGEELQRDMSARLETAQRDTDAMSAALLETSEREQELSRTQAEQSGRLKADVERLIAELDRERADRSTDGRRKDAAIHQLQEELAQWDDSIQALLVDVGRLEAVLQAREDEFTAFRHEAERREAELTARVAAVKKDADGATRRVQDVEVLRDQAVRELAQARERSVIIEKGLREELAGVQRDLSGMLMASDCVRQAVEEQQTPKPSSINWMDQAHEPDRAPKGPSPAEQLELLNRKIRTSAEEKEALRRELDALRSGHEELKRSAGEQTAQLQQQVQVSGGLLQQALEETERREGLLRAVRKKAEDRERELLERIEHIEASQVETVVVEPEVLAPGTTWERPVEGAREAEGAPASGRQGLDLLNTVEAQLRAELKKWEALSQGSANGKAKKWFGRK